MKPENGYIAVGEMKFAETVAATRGREGLHGLPEPRLFSGHSCSGPCQCRHFQPSESSHFLPLSPLNSGNSPLVPCAPSSSQNAQEHPLPLPQPSMHSADLKPSQASSAPDPVRPGWSCCPQPAPPPVLGPHLPSGLPPCCQLWSMLCARTYVHCVQKPVHQVTTTKPGN